MFLHRSGNNTSTGLAGRLSRGMLGVVMIAGLLGVAGPVGTATAAVRTALVLDSTVSGGLASIEATEATANGFTVTLASDADWAAMTSAQFAAYDLLVVGDPTCSFIPEAVSSNATALADAVMARAGGRAIVGNRVLIGTDPVFHSTQGGDKLVETAMDFAGVKLGASNLYLDVSCVDEDYDSNSAPDVLDKLLPLLTSDSTPGWTENQSPPCGGSASLISNADQFASLTSADLQGWGCSVHETFPTYPSDWVPLALATDAPTQPTCGTDVDTSLPACGEAYILISGSGITATAPNLALTPPTTTKAVGASHTVTAAVTQSGTSTPAAGVLVTFTITGANAAAVGTCVPVSCVSDAAGQVTFTYTGTSAGDDTIYASITVSGTTQTATAAATWTTGANSAPTITAASGSVQYSDALAPTLTVTAADADAGDTLSLGATGLPTALSFTDNGNRTGTVAGTATSAVGVYPVTYTVNDGHNPQASADGAITITKEDCTVGYTGDMTVAPATSTTLSAALGEPDASLGNRSNKTVTFTVTDSSSVVQTFTAVTNASGVASTTVPLPSGVYAVAVSFAGDSSYLSCATQTDAVVTVAAAAAKVTGGGWTSVATGRTNFGFNVIPQAVGFKGQFQLRSEKSKFHGNTATSLVVSGKNATWTGTGSWNGQSGFTFQVWVVDNGSGGKKAGDTIRIVIKNASGSVVFTTGAAPVVLKGGNITVH